MPPNDSPGHDGGRDRRQTNLHPDATDVAQARALLSEIERRVAEGKFARSTTVPDAVARIVRGLFGDG